MPGPNFSLGGIIILLDLFFASNYRAHDIILKNGMLRYKLWLGSKYKSINIENIKNIYLRDMAINKKRKRAISLVIYTDDDKTEEIPIFFAYKKRYDNLIKLLNK